MADIEKIKEEIKLKFYEKLILKNEKNNDALKFISNKIEKKSELTEKIKGYIENNTKKIEAEMKAAAEKLKKTKMSLIMNYRTKKK